MRVRYRIIAQTVSDVAEKIMEIQDWQVYFSHLLSLWRLYLLIQPDFAVQEPEETLFFIN